MRSSCEVNKLQAQHTLMAVSEASESKSSDLQACRLLGLNVPEELGFGADLSDAFILN